MIFDFDIVAVNGARGAAAVSDRVNIFILFLANCTALLEEIIFSFTNIFTRSGPTNPRQRNQSILRTP